jgi:RHS repeat-associated protein
MPSALPSLSAFTYCVDITIDGVKDDQNVTFDKPLTLIVDNFLNFPVGAIVPVGYYDRNRGEWIASDNGVIVKLLDTDNDGIIDALDSDGDGRPNDLNGDGSYLDEVAGLTSDLYKVGESYQYAQINHFTPWDFNYPYAPPADAAPIENDAFVVDSPFGVCYEDTCNNTGSYVSSKTQEHHDDIEIAGTDISLHYSSRSASGYVYTVEAPIDLRSAPPSLKSAKVKLEIAGNRYERPLELNRLNNTSFEWDGKDALGKRLSGSIEGTITVDYLYNFQYTSGSTEFSQAWAKAGGASFGIKGRDLITYPYSKKVKVLVDDTNNDANEIANGWTIEDDLFLNLRFNGYLSSALSHKYITSKGKFIFATETQLESDAALEALNEIIGGARSLHYSLWENWEECQLELKIFTFENNVSHDIKTIILGNKQDMFDYEHTGSFSCSDTGEHMPTYSFYDFYKGTKYDGLSERYFDASDTPWELKAKVRERIDANASYLAGYTPYAYTGIEYYTGIYWIPTENVYAKLDDLYSGDFYDAFNSSEFLDLHPSAKEGDIVILNSNLGYIYEQSSGKLKAVFDNATKQIARIYGYDEKNKLISIKDRFGNEVKITRDANGRASAIVAPSGQTTKLSISAKNNLSAVTYEDNSAYKLEYATESNALLSKKITPNSSLYQYVYDRLGRTVKTINAEGGEWLFEKSVAANSQDLVYKTAMPEGDATIYTETTDAAGTLALKTTLPSGDTYTQKINKDGTESAKTVDGVITETKRAKDPLALNNILQSQTITTPNGLKRTTTQTIAYDGNVTALKSKTIKATTNSKTITTVENYAEGKITISSPSNAIKQTILYDKQSGLTKSYQYANLTPIDYEYDQKGRLIKASIGEIARTIYTYDEKGNVASITDANGLTTAFSFDLLGRLIKAVYPNGDIENYSYDKDGNVVKFVTPKSKVFNFENSKLGQRISLISPLSKTTRYAYDKDKRPLWISYQSGKKVAYSYEKGELKKVTTPERTYDYSYLFYNKVGSIQTDDGAKTSYAYDGGLLTKIAYEGIINHEIAFAHNGDFNPTSITYLGKTDNYAYSADNLLSKSGDWTISRLLATGFVSKISKSGYGKTYSYDNLGAITEIKDNVYTQQIIDRYPNQKIKSLKDNLFAATLNYEYDELGRLVKVISGNYADNANRQTIEQYSYDEQGNRVAATVYGKSVIASYNDDDELIAYGDRLYSYNADGFLLSKTTPEGVTKYAYGALGELRSVTLPDNTNIRYYYDANNQRVAKEVNGSVVHRYLWLNNTTLLGFYDKEGNLARFTYATDRTPIQMDYKGKSYYLSHNHLESLTAISNESNKIVKQLSYDSFGNVLSQTNPSLNTTYADQSLDDLDIPLGFAGGLYDKDTKLIRFGYRDYDPFTGRWTAKDPIDFNGGSSNLYAYVGNDPINWVDSSGLRWEYSQTTGELRYVDENGDSTLIATGYSGTNRNGYNSRNNPTEQWRRDNGPIPQGQWRIGEQTNTRRLRAALPLIPMNGTETFGRTGFFAHGEGTQHPNDSSDGCIILPPNIRERINNSGDNILVVVP